MTGMQRAVWTEPLPHYHLRQHHHYHGWCWVSASGSGAACGSGPRGARGALLTDHAPVWGRGRGQARWRRLAGSLEANSEVSDLGLQVPGGGGTPAAVGP